MKVFLSSTAQDLSHYRQAADDTLLRLSQKVEAMERFGPLPRAPIDACEERARACDLLICIVAHRYGVEPEPGRGSFTRREVEAAHAAGNDVLVWIVDDGHAWTEIREQDRLKDPTVLADPARVQDVAKSVAALLDFKAWLRATFVCEAFTTPDDLAKSIAIAVANHAEKRTSAMPPAPRAKGEIRIVHALQPAPHFRGRAALFAELDEWVSDLASPDRVWSLVAAGGTGKTAVVERVVRTMDPGTANVLVWSFYEDPKAEAFLAACNDLFLGEDRDAPIGGRLERLQRGLRDGRPHLLVLDGLERVQEEAGPDRARGALADRTLELLLRAIAAGLGRTRALVTSRFPLTDLAAWIRQGYRETRLDDLSSVASVAVLRGWGVVGDDVALAAAAKQVGHHALSVAVLGSYLKFCTDGDVTAVGSFNLDAVTGDDPKAAKLARVLARYAERLPEDERALLARLSVFPRGVTLELLGDLIDAGGEVAGVLVHAKPQLVLLLNRLKCRGLVFAYRDEMQMTWTAHPFLRDRFRALLGCPTTRVFEVVADALGSGLEKRPAEHPTNPETLDRYERLIEATRLAGRENEAFELYWSGMGSYPHLGPKLGAFQRGYRIVMGFSATGRIEDLAPGLPLILRSLLANELVIYAIRLGRLFEAQAIGRVDIEWARTVDSATQVVPRLRNAAECAFHLGRLRRAEELAEEAFASEGENHHKFSLASKAMVAHARGDIANARAYFQSATVLEGGPLISLRGLSHARHQLDLGHRDAAVALCESGLGCAQRYGWGDEIAWYEALRARIALAAGQDPTPNLAEIHAWSAHSGDMEAIIRAHLLTAQHALATSHLQDALDEANTGLLHATTCGYRLLEVELLITRAQIHLAWPNAPAAIQSAREALDLATASECGYAWGEADAAQVWGEAYFSNRELELARRAFMQALTVRRRIEHPGVQDTETWLARLPS